MTISAASFTGSSNSTFGAFTTCGDQIASASATVTVPTSGLIEYVGGGTLTAVSPPPDGPNQHIAVWLCWCDQESGSCHRFSSFQPGAASVLPETTSTLIGALRLSPGTHHVFLAATSWGDPAAVTSYTLADVWLSLSVRLFE